MPLRRCACSGRKRYAGQVPAPPGAAAALRPGSAVRCAAASGPPPPPGSAPLRGRSPARFPARLSRSGCRAGAGPASPGRPLPPAGLAPAPAAASAGSGPGRPPVSLPVALGPLRAPCGRPVRRCGLLAAPVAAPRRRGPPGRRSRRLPSVVPPSVAGLVALRCACPPGLRPGGLWRLRRLVRPRPPGRGFGVFRRCGGGRGNHHAAALLGLLRVVLPWLSFCPPPVPVALHTGRNRGAGYNIWWIDRIRPAVVS